MADRRDEVRRSRLRSRALTQVREVIGALERGSYIAANGAPVDIAPAVAACVDGTVFVDAASVPPAATAGASTRVTVTREDTIAAALRLGEDHRRVALLNFASATQPGGSWHCGMRAQEEDLVRSTALLECLERSAAAARFFASHEAAGPPLFADVCLISPRVPAVRDGSGRLRPDPVPLDVISCAAPRADLAADPDAVAAARRRRIAMILFSAAELRADALVLGAWGCGAYENNPIDVADEFAAALADAAGPVAEVVFAIRDDSRDRSTARAFELALGS